MGCYMYFCSFGANFVVLNKRSSHHIGIQLSSHLTFYMTEMKLISS